MILIAPQPNTDFKANARVYHSDERQIIYDVEPEDSLALATSSACSIAPKAIVCHTFPDGMSIHCFGCGAFIVMPPDEDRWFWIRKGEVCIDFITMHKDHVDWIWTPNKTDTEPNISVPVEAPDPRFEPVQPVFAYISPDPIDPMDEILNATL